MNITIGQYYPKDSLIHRLDPRIKIIFIFLYVVSIFLTDSFFIYSFSSLFLIFTIILSKVPPLVILKTLKPFIYIFFITTIINILVMPEGKILINISIFKITYGGLVYSIKILFRIIILMLSSSIISLTTNPIEFTDAFESLLKPLKKVNFPSHEISLMLSIALRFIPTILDEFEKIKKAQMSRGADFETGNFIRKIKAFIPLLIPIFISSFKRADELAIAMEARCYRGDINRTRLKVFKLKKIDFWAIFIFSLYFITVLIFKIHFRG